VQWPLFLLWLLNLLVVVKLIRMAPHTRLEKIQPLPTMDGIVLVTIDGLMHCAANGPMAFVLEDQVLVHRKICSNLNTIDEQFQLVVLFVPPQGDQFNYFLFRPSPFSKKVCAIFLVQ